MEILDVFDEFNNSLNYSKLREDVHNENLWHRHVSCWIMNYNGDILLQKRSRGFSADGESCLHSGSYEEKR